MPRTPQVEPGEHRYEITHLWDRHKAILRLLVQGWSNKQIAMHLGISPQTVSIVRNSALAQEHLAHLHDLADLECSSMNARLAANAPVALEVLEEMMTSPATEEKTRAKIALGLLDRAGFGPSQKTLHKHQHMHVTPADIEDIKRRAREAGMVVDVSRGDDGQARKACSFPHEAPQVCEAHSSPTTGPVLGPPAPPAPFTPAPYTDGEAPISREAFARIAQEALSAIEEVG